ncbi:MAG: sigma-70 family RNA polymerase sigma factor [Pseudomonadota bacterium]
MVLPQPHHDARALVAAAQAGDERAWRTLVVAWLPVVHGWCARLGGPRVEPHDAVQDVFETVWLRLPTVADPACFPRWICTITRRVLDRHRRRAWLRRWLPGPLPPQRDRGAAPDLQVAHSEVSRRVQALLERLPRAQREVLVLCDVEGRTSPEVATLLDIPEGTVRSRLRLGRARFQAEAGGPEAVAALVADLGEEAP